MTINQNRTDFTGIVWDAHTCVPITPDADLSCLLRHKQAGASYVSINVGMDFNPKSQIFDVLKSFNSYFEENQADFILTKSVKDIREAKKEGKLAVSFDLEGSVMLDDDPDMLTVYKELGVRQILLAYNRDNSIAGGCHGAGIGLTKLGFQIVKEINRAGLIMDCSHSSKRSSLDIMETSTKPVVFSHSNIRQIQDHPRNIDDEQIKACAETDGVIGICGISHFLGNGDVRAANLIEHINYVADLVGPQHVGLGLDYVFNQQHDDLPANLNHDDWWPQGFGYQLSSWDITPPEELLLVADELQRNGYHEHDIAGIMGENFLRVAEATWN